MIQETYVLYLSLNKLYLSEFSADCLFSLFDDCELNVSYAVGSNPSNELKWRMGVNEWWLY